MSLFWLSASELKALADAKIIGLVYSTSNKSAITAKYISNKPCKNCLQVGGFTVFHQDYSNCGLWNMTEGCIQILNQVCLCSDQLTQTNSWFVLSGNRTWNCSFRGLTDNRARWLEYSKSAKPIFNLIFEAELWFIIEDWSYYVSFYSDLFWVSLVLCQPSKFTDSSGFPTSFYVFNCFPASFRYFSHSFPPPSPITPFLWP